MVVAKSDFIDYILLSKVGIEELISGRKLMAVSLANADAGKSLITTLSEFNDCRGHDPAAKGS